MVASSTKEEEKKKTLAIKYPQQVHYGSQKTQHSLPFSLASYELKNKRGKGRRGSTEAFYRTLDRRAACREHERHRGDPGGAVGGGPGGGDPDGTAPALVAGPVPDPAGADRVAARVQRGRPRPGAGDPGRPRQGTGLLLPARRAARRAGGGGAPGGVHGGGGLVHRGLRELQLGGRRLLGAPADDPQGRAAAPSPTQAGPRRGGNPDPPRPGDEVYLRGDGDRVPVQPRGGGWAGGGAVHGGGGGDGARGGAAVGGAGVVPRRDPGAARAVPGPAAEAVGGPAGVPGDGHLGGVHRALQEPVPGADGAALLGLRGADRQGLAEPHPRGGAAGGGGDPPVLRDERAAAAGASAAPHGGILRQLLLHHARLVHQRQGGGRVHRGDRAADQGGQEAAPARVRALGRGRRGGSGRGPVPDHLRLPQPARLRLDAPGLRRGRLRLGPARPRRPVDQPRLHRHVHTRQALRP